MFQRVLVEFSDMDLLSVCINVFICEDGGIYCDRRLEIFTPRVLRTVTARVIHTYSLTDGVLCNIAYLHTMVLSITMVSGYNVPYHGTMLIN